MSENPEQYSQEQALEEASAMRDIVDSHHVDTYQEAATIIDKKAEQLLSPELIEQISNR